MHVRDLEKSDIPALKASGLDVQAFLLPHNRIHLAIEGGIVGLAIWLAPQKPQPALLTAISTTDRAPPETIHHLALRAAEAAQFEGYTHAIFDIYSRSLMNRLVDLYGIEPTPVGVDPLTRQVEAWRQEVKLTDALSILRPLVTASTS